MKILNEHIAHAIEESNSQRFWLRIANSLVISCYLVSFGTSMTKSGYISVVAGVIMMSGANFIIVFSVWKIRKTIL